MDDDRPVMGLGMHPAAVLDPNLAAGRGAEFSAGALVSSSSTSSSTAECSAPSPVSLSLAGSNAGLLYKVHHSVFSAQFLLLPQPAP
jgi:hypothetical protein